MPAVARPLFTSTESSDGSTGSIMHVDALTLAFKGGDATLEGDFLREYHGESPAMERAAVIAGALIIAVFGILDAFLLPTEKYFMWAVRYAVLLPGAVLVLILSTVKGFARYYAATKSAMLLVTGIGCIAMILRATPPASYLYYSGLILIILFGFTVFRLRFITGTLVAWGTVIAYVVAVSVAGGTPEVILVSNLFFLASATVIGMLASYSIEMHARRDFYLRRRLEQEKETVRKTNDELESRVQERTGRLNRSLAWREAIFEGSRDAIFIAGADARFIETNQAAVALTGYTRDELLTMRIPDLHENEDREAYVQHFGRIMGGEEALTEARTRRKDGTRVDTEFSNRRVEIEGVSYMHTTARDITARKKVEEALQRSVSEKEVLLKELQHRVKNNLAIISSLLGLEMRRLTDETARQVFLEAQTRISAMAALYDQLYGARDLNDINLGLYLDRLARTILDTYSTLGGRIALETALEDVHLDVKRAVPLGLILNEVLTNAVKYAFPDGKRGTVRVALAESAGRITLAISDDGVGLPAGFDLNAPGSMGFMLVKLLCEQIGASLDVGAANGSRITARFGR